MGNKTNLRKMALTGGASLIAMAVLAGIGYGYGFMNIYVAGNTTATLQNLNNAPQMLQLVIFSFVLILVLDVVVAWALFHFFKQGNPKLSLLSAWLRVIYTGWLGVAVLKLFSAMTLADSAIPDGAAIMDSLQLFLDIWSWGLILFGLHLLVLGYIVLRSGYIPKFIGWLTLFAALSYLFNNLANLVVLHYEQYKGTVEAVLGLPMALGELVLAVWLLVKGGKLP